MSTRMNFDAEDELCAQIDATMQSAGIPTKRQLFERSIALFLRIHQLVDLEDKAVVALANAKIEALMAAGLGLEVVARPNSPTYRWLVHRCGDWRKTPWIKGTRIHVADLRYLLEADTGLTPKQLATELELPQEAIDEGLTYCRLNADLLDAEEREAALRSRTAEPQASMRNAPASR